MLKVRRSVLTAAAASSFAASIERVDAASNCNPSGAIPCEVMYSVFGKDARQGMRPQTDLRQSAFPAIGPPAAGTARRRVPTRPARPVVQVNSQVTVASSVTAPPIGWRQSSDCRIRPRQQAIRSRGSSFSAGSSPPPVCYRCSSPKPLTSEGASLGAGHCILAPSAQDCLRLGAVKWHCQF
jgi:hypothetical protein